jgi:hypothetical protein
MNLYRHIQRWFDTEAPESDRDPRPDYVHGSVIRHHERHEMTRGVDLPRWRTPKELAQLRRMERRAALRVVGGKGA